MDGLHMVGSVSQSVTCREQNCLDEMGWTNKNIACSTFAHTKGTAGGEAVGQWGKNMYTMGLTRFINNISEKLTNVDVGCKNISLSSRILYDTYVFFTTRQTMIWQLFFSNFF